MLIEKHLHLNCPFPNVKSAPERRGFGCVVEAMLQIFDILDGNLGGLRTFQRFFPWTQGLPVAESTKGAFILGVSLMSLEATKPRRSGFLFGDIFCLPGQGQQMQTS